MSGVSFIISLPPRRQRSSWTGLDQYKLDPVPRYGVKGWLRRGRTSADENGFSGLASPSDRVLQGSGTHLSAPAPHMLRPDAGVRSPSAGGPLSYRRPAL